MPQPICERTDIMNLDQLKYLAYLAKTNSMNETAKRMFITQPAVSDAIKRLEHELGCTILKRSKTGTAFTEDGEVVLDCAQQMLAQYDRLSQYLQSKYHKEQLHGRLILGVGPAVSDAILPVLLLKMHQQYPNITLQVIETASMDILNLIHRSEMDFGLFSFDEQYFNTAHISLDNFQFQELYSDDVVTVITKKHPLANQDTVYLSELSEYKQTTYGYDYSYMENANALHISNNAKIHQQFMLEENTLCCMPYRTYLAHYPQKQFIAKKPADVKPIHYYLIFQKEFAPENRLIYQTFIETATSLSKEFA